MQNEANPSADPAQGVPEFEIVSVDHTYRGRIFYKIRCHGCGRESVEPRYRFIGHLAKTCPECALRQFRESGLATPEWAQALGFDETFWPRFWPNIDKNGPVPSHQPELGNCWIWLRGVNGNGYGSIMARKIGSQPFLISCHRASLSIHLKRPLLDHEWVLHHCDVPRCCRPEHLYIGDARDNSDDCLGRGRDRHPCGEQHPNAVMTCDMVRQMRVLHSQGNTYREIAAMFNVSPSTVAMAVRGDTWSHVV